MRAKYIFKNVILIIFLLFNTALANEYNSKGTGVIKHQIVRDPWIGIDKVQHILYSKFISLGMQYILVNKMHLSEKKALPISTLSSFLAGLSKEIADSKSNKNIFSKKDMIANSLGLIAASFIINR
jgi:uncharacterized protein YfiM (DUF2279 family)